MGGGRGGDGTRARGPTGSAPIIPDGVGITWELVPGDEGTRHFDLFGDKDVLKRYLATDFHLDVVDADRVGSGEMR
jgi:hypothetical protein